MINDFEPVSAWACMQKKIPCIALSHQSTLLQKNVPKIKNKDLFSRYILKNYAPYHRSIGFHFCNYDKNIYTPVIRSQVRSLEIKEKDYYLVYLPSYGDEKLTNILSQFEDIKWKVFSKHAKKPSKNKNIEILPLSNDKFIKHFGQCKGIICGAGFETPAEALFLGKKLIVIPMKNQIEQHYNAAALKAIGIPVLRSLSKKYLPEIRSWLETGFKIEIEYPDITNRAINKAFEIYVNDLRKAKLKKRKIKLTI